VQSLNIPLLLISALPILFAITIHEAAHGYVARHFGDNTAYMLGRITLNPIKHIDPVGTVLIPLVLFLTHSPFLFGYAKPVPVNFGQLRHPKRDMVWVALAGPGANLAQALIWAAILTALIATGFEERFFVYMCKAGIQFNLMLAAFNLFPVPPLDGGRVLVGLLPRKQAYAVSRIEPWGFFIVMGLVLLGVISNWWMWPLVNVGYALLGLFGLSP
jgi:Zn-dependent protease